MDGNELNDGIIPRSFEMVLKYINECHHNGFQYILELSLFNIHNKSVFDLLNDDNVNTDSNDESRTFSSIRKFRIESLKEIGDILLKTKQKRGKQNHILNASHAITQLHISCISSDGIKIVTGQVTFIDLANTEKDLEELTNALSSYNNKKELIYYGDSKLIQFLKTNLNTTCKTLMILNISLHSKDFIHSKNTLQFGSAVNNMKMKLLL